MCGHVRRVPHRCPLTGGGPCFKIRKIQQPPNKEAEGNGRKLTLPKKLFAFSLQSVRTAVEAEPPPYRCRRKSRCCPSRCCLSRCCLRRRRWSGLPSGAGGCQKAIYRNGGAALKICFLANPILNPGTTGRFSHV